MKGKSRRIEKIEAYVQTEEGLEAVAQKVKEGQTMEQIAQGFGVSRTTFYRWVKKYPDLDDVLFNSTQYLLDQVEESLYRNCFPQEITETKTVLDRNGNVKYTIITEKTKEASTQALIFVLTNAKRRWHRETNPEGDLPQVLTPEQYKAKYGREWNE